MLVFRGQYQCILGTRWKEFIISVTGILFCRPTFDMWVPPCTSPQRVQSRLSWSLLELRQRQGFLFFQYYQRSTTWLLNSLDKFLKTVTLSYQLFVMSWPSWLRSMPSFVQLRKRRVRVSKVVRLMKVENIWHDVPNVQMRLIRICLFDHSGKTGRQVVCPALFSKEIFPEFSLTTVMLLSLQGKVAEVITGSFFALNFCAMKKWR